LRHTIGYVAARPLRYRPRIFHDCPGGGDQGEWVLRHAQVAAPERCEVAGDTNENPDKPQSHALTVAPLRRIFDTYDRGKRHRHRTAGRVRCRITFSRGSNIDDHCRPVSSASIAGSPGTATGRCGGAYRPGACQDRYKAIFMNSSSAARSAAARQHRHSGPASRGPPPAPY